MTLSFVDFTSDVQSQPQLLTIASNVNDDIEGVKAFDIYLDESGNLAMSNNEQAVLEACAQAANTLLGEVVLNVNIGIPYEQVVWVGVPNIQQFEASVKSAFLAVGGGGFVTGVPYMNVSVQNNILNYVAIIESIYGKLSLTGAVSA